MELRFDCYLINVYNLSGYWLKLEFVFTSKYLHISLKRIKVDRIRLNVSLILIDLWGILYYKMCWRGYLIITQ